MQDSGGTNRREANEATGAMGAYIERLRNGGSVPEIGGMMKPSISLGLGQLNIPETLWDLGAYLGSGSGATGQTVCGDLKCLCRPRFFAGQLLTEEDLQCLDYYIVEKNKLHNRYVHGPGVVSGLQVVCHSCSGWVTVKQGYAVGPCGDDIIVCTDHDFDLIEAIRKCKEAQRRRREECEPLRSASKETCKDVPEYWCLTIEYAQQPVRPMAALRREPAPWDNCCRDTQEAGVKASIAKKASTKESVIPCEPTRVLEGYRLGVAEGSPNACRDLGAMLGDTMITRIVGCVGKIAGIFFKRVPGPKMLFLTAKLLLGFGRTHSVLRDLGVEEGSAFSQEECCTLYRLVADLYRENPLNVHCSAERLLEEVECPADPLEGMTEAQRKKYLADMTEEERNAYLVDVAAKIRVAIGRLRILLLQYVLDCVCQAVLPPSPPDPGDNRLVLACMTVKNDRIEHICNFACRRYAGSFTSWNYWLPILPILFYAAQRICCEPERFSMAWEALDPGKKMRKAMLMNKGALLKQYVKGFQKVRHMVSFDGLAEVIHKKEGVNLFGVLDMPAEEVRITLDEAGVVNKVYEVESEDEVPLAKTLITHPIAGPEDSIGVYVKKETGKVIGYARLDRRAEVKEKDIELKTLREEFKEKDTELKTIRTELATLKNDLDALRGR